MGTGNRWSQVRTLYKKYRRLVIVFFVLISAYCLLNGIGIFYKPLSPDRLLTKQSADSAKILILGFGPRGPLLFIAAQVLQVAAVPIPGQVVGFLAGYIFGWSSGVVYSMTGLTVGMLLVFSLSRRLGRGFVEKLNGPEALKDFEESFLSPESQSGSLYARSKTALRSHGLLTFFLIMLLPGLPDNLACFAAGLTKIPIWKLMVAAVIGRFPATLMLALIGDGWSRAESSMTLLIFAGAALLLTALYLWKKQQIEQVMRRLAGSSRTSD